MFPVGDGYVIALTYGPGTDWVKNVLAAGGCELRTRGHTVRLISPRVFHDESRHDIRPVERQVLRVLGVADFLSLNKAPAASATPGQSLSAAAPVDMTLRTRATKCTLMPPVGRLCWLDRGAHQQENDVDRRADVTGGRMGDVDPWVEFERLSHADPTDLTHAQRRLLALGGLRAEMNNGGFHQYFFNSAGDLVSDAVDAAEASGVTELALLIRHALDLLDLQDPADRWARQDSLDDLDPEQFADIDDAYYALEASADLDSAMRGFIMS